TKICFSPTRTSPTATMAERQAAILGFVYAPFRMNDLMQDILGSEHEFVALRIFDGRDIQPDNLMYDSATEHTSRRVMGKFVHRESLLISGREWTLELQSTPALDASMNRKEPEIILVGGLLFSLLLFGFMGRVTHQRDQAVDQTKKATDALTVNTSMTKAILETAVNAIVTMNADRRIITFNLAAEEMFGYTRAEVIGENVKMLMPDPYHVHHDGYIERYIRTRESRIIKVGGREVLGLRKDGTIFPLWLAVGEVLVGEKQIFVGCIVDITERKQTEHDLLAAKEAAENANRAKSEFLNMMSHELRTPLTVILGYLPLLTRTESKNPTAKKLFQALADRPEAELLEKFMQQIGKMAGEMHRNGEHLLTLINDLLDIAKIESGKFAMDFRVVDAGEIVRGVLDALRVKADEKNLRLANTLESLLVMADATRLRQILINLIGNAIKFTDQGVIHVTIVRSGNFAEFAIADTGQGIPPDELERIFDRFHQVDRSATRRVGGSGLGLTITRKLVDISGGTITVTSTPDAGSTFRFTIPLAQVM
ncbi:MAG: PAS domain S-box protein, partial [Magnetococcales bacterium]|nr:PAS domain S-box protein [Magnetococcales bacterium]